MGILAKLCEKVVEVRRVCDRVMTAVVVFEEDVLSLNSIDTPHNVEDVCKVNSLFMMSLYVRGICILQMI